MITVATNISWTLEMFQTLLSVSHCYLPLSFQKPYKVRLLLIPYEEIMLFSYILIFANMMGEVW